MGVHMDIVGSAVRARYYDPRGEWQKMTIVKQEGGVIRDGDKIFIRSVFKNGRDYMDANPLEKIADGEVKCRWPDEGEWQVLTIEKWEISATALLSKYSCSSLAVADA